MRMWQRAAVFLLSLSVAVFAHAGTFLVKKIRVEGLTRIDVGTVYNDLPVQVGDRFDTRDTSQLIHALYKTGFYNDIRIVRQGSTLVVRVSERPTIGRLTVVGNEAISDDNLFSALKTIGLAKGWTFQRSSLERIKQELEEQYYSRGKYNVSVKTTVKSLPRNRVAVHIAIVEGVEARIKRIDIVGNHAFSDDTLHALFSLSASSSWWTSLTDKNKYSQVKFRGDLETLRSYYLDRGYLKFAIESTEVALSADKRSVYLTVNVHEGQVYRVGRLAWKGRFVVPEAELRKQVKTQVGDLFSRKQIRQDVSAMVKRLGEEGYAFAKIQPMPQVNNTTQRVNLTFSVMPGRRVYVHQIHFHGNRRTQDAVLRANVPQMESAVLLGKHLDNSKLYLQRLGFFSQVSVKLTPVSGVPNQVDLDYKVEERDSGKFTFGIGYSRLRGLTFKTSISEANFLGSGKKVDLTFNRDASFTQYRIGYYNPYYTVNRIGRGFDLYFRETELGRDNISRYTTDEAGVAVNYDIPLTDVDRVSFSLGYKNSHLNIGNDPSAELQKFVTDEGDDYHYFTVGAGWSHSALNKAIFPTEGTMYGVSLFTALPNNTLQFYKVSGQWRWLRPINQRYIWDFRSKLAFGGSYGSKGSLPFLENFFSGGIGSVRGYDANTLGPRDSKGDALGGNVSLLGSVNLIVPTPFTEGHAVRTSVFVDAGNVYKTEKHRVNLGDLRYSAGVSVEWWSPLGPLTVVLATPLKEHDDDHPRLFDFTIGTTF